MDTNEQHFDIKKYFGDYVKGIKTHEELPTLIDRAINDYFTSNLPFLQTVQFAYAVDLQRKCICYQYNFSSYLGYDVEQVNIDLLHDILHPNEQKKLMALYLRMFEFPKYYTVEPIKYGLVLGHQLRKADGTYIKVLRQMHPFLLDENGKLLVYYCICLDVTQHAFSQGITLDIILAPDAPFTRSEVLNFFGDIMSGTLISLTPRQLEVIKIWSETDSSKLAAERLSMRVRTLETHLKNIRKKLGVRRTLDVVLYAKAKGLI